MKKTILTFGLFSLMMVLTSFTSPIGNQGAPRQIIEIGNQGAPRQISEIGNQGAPRQIGNQGAPRQ